MITHGKIEMQCFNAHFSLLQKANLLWGGGGGGSEKTTTSVGGGGGTTNGGSGGQGLAHWMSVMAEHMNHETTPLHPAYMWNGVEV